MSIFERVALDVEDGERSTLGDVFLLNFLDEAGRVDVAAVCGSRRRAVEIALEAGFTEDGYPNIWNVEKRKVWQ